MLPLDSEQAAAARRRSCGRPRASSPAKRLGVLSKEKARQRKRLLAGSRIATLPATMHADPTHIDSEPLPIEEARLAR